MDLVSVVEEGRVLLLVFVGLLVGVVLLGDMVLDGVRRQAEKMAMVVTQLWEHKCRAVGGKTTDRHRRQWSQHWHWQWQSLNICRHKLPWQKGCCVFGHSLVYNQGRHGAH